MFALSRTTRVFLKVGATDLRLGFDGLYGQVVSILKQDLLSAHRRGDFPVISARLATAIRVR